MVKSTKIYRGNKNCFVRLLLMMALLLVGTHTTNVYAANVYSANMHTIRAMSAYEAMTPLRMAIPLHNSTEEGWAESHLPRTAVSATDIQTAKDIWVDLRIKLKEAQLLPIIQDYIERKPTIIFRHPDASLPYSALPRIHYFMQDSAWGMVRLMCTMPMHDHTGVAAVPRPIIYTGSLNKKSMVLNITGKEQGTFEEGGVVRTYNKIYFPPGNNKMQEFSKPYNPYDTNTAYEIGMPLENGGIGHMGIHPSGDVVSYTEFDNAADCIANSALASALPTVVATQKPWLITRAFKALLGRCRSCRVGKKADCHSV